MLGHERVLQGPAACRKRARAQRQTAASQDNDGYPAGLPATPDRPPTRNAAGTGRPPEAPAAPEPPKSTGRRRGAPGEPAVPGLQPGRALSRGSPPAGAAPPHRPAVRRGGVERCGRGGQDDHGDQSRGGSGPGVRRAGPPRGRGPAKLIGRALPARSARRAAGDLSMRSSIRISASTTW